MKNKIILDLCGGSGNWSLPYKEAGYDVRIIDKKNWHYLSDNQDLVEYYNPPENVYGVLAAPPCTEFSKALRRERNFKEGMKVVRSCLNIIWRIQESSAMLKFWCLENPLGYLNRFLGHPAYYFQPWQFGDQSYLKTKRTYLWGYFNKPATIRRKRDFPYVNPYASRNGLSGREKRNIGFDNANSIDRAKTSLFFSRAFFKANQ